MTRCQFLISAALLILAPIIGRGLIEARGQTWNGPGTDWNTAGNWSPATVPNSTSAAVTFAGNGVGTVIISSSVSAQSLTFSNPTGSYDLTSSANQTLSGVSAITMAAGVTGLDSVQLANVSTGSLLFPAGSGLFVANLTITNNSTMNALFFNNTMVIGTPGIGGVIVGGAGTVSIGGSFAAAPNQVVGGLTKNGPGELDFTGDGSNLGGGITLNGGTLLLLYSTFTASKLGSGGLTLGGGEFQVEASPGTSMTQVIPGGTVVATGHTDAQGSGNITLNAGSITQNPGGTVDFTGSVTFSITTSTGNTHGLLGAVPAFGTVDGGSTWATVSGGAVAGLTTYGTDTYAAGTNTDLTTSATVAGFTTNSLRFNTGNLTLTLSGTNTLQSGGILVTPNANGGTITGGTITAPSSGELLFHVYSNLTVNSALVSSTGLTKTGSATLTLGGTNAGLTGPINVNRGNLTVTALAAVNSASAINFNDLQTGGNLQQFIVDLGNNIGGTISPPILVSAFSNGTDYGTHFSTGSSTGSSITLSGVLSSAAGQTTPIRFTSSGSDTSGFDLTNTNTFTGNIDLFHGSLGITADASLGNAANILTLEVNDTSNGGLVFLNGGINVAHAITVNQPTRIVSNGTDTNTISSVISGTGGIFKDGTGTLKITNANNIFTGGITVNAGTLSLGPTGSLTSGTNITVAAGATFSPGTSSIISLIGLGTLTLYGGTLRVSAGTGNSMFFNQIVTGTAGGTLDYTGAGTDGLGLFNAGAGITVNGNSTWLSPANGTTIVNNNAAAIPVLIAPGVTLINGFALGTGGGFQITGGGTLFQNSDATNVQSMAAPVTVTQGEFRVTDASSNGGVGNFGTGTFTLDGGTLSYGGATAATSKAFALTANGGIIQVESAATTLTASGAITGPGPLTKIGPGTLVLTSSGDSFSSLTITAGTIQTAHDNSLGLGPVTVGGLGTLQYTATTSSARTFNLNYGTLAANAGATVTLNGAAVVGGFLSGTGTFATGATGAVFAGVTSVPSVTIISNSAADQFINFSNSAPFSIAAGVNTAGSFTPTNLNGFINQGSGSVTIGTGSQLNVANFQSYGGLTLNPATVSGQFTELANTGPTALYFNGGSQTFIGSATAPNANTSGVDLHGQNLVLAGALFVNNGIMFSSTGGGTIYVEYGALYKGAGTTNVNIITQNGGKVQAGNSPGRASFGQLVFGPGGIGNYVFAIDDATGTAGPSASAAGQVDGWGLIKTVQQTFAGSSSSGNFTWTATPASKLTISLETLVNPTTVGTDVAGPMAAFDPTQSYTWPAAEWAGTYSGPADAATLDASTSFDTTGFLNPIAGTFGWSLDQSDQMLLLVYTPSPVPEPGTLALVGAAALCFGWSRRRRHFV